jgi:hypothetical protein
MFSSLSGHRVSVADVGPLHSSLGESTMARKLVVGQRSGRFNIEAMPVDDIVLSKGTGGFLYRILNSGKNDFQVNYGGSDRTVPKRGCLDVLLSTASGKNELKVLKAANISGIYEIPSPGSEGRSGRFRFGPDDNPGNPHIIIDLSQGPASRLFFYRLFNAGENPIEFQEGGTSLYTLLPSQSADLPLRGGQTYSVKCQDLGGGNFGPISGVFDLLSMR